VIPDTFPRAYTHIDIYTYIHTHIRTATTVFYPTRSRIPPKSPRCPLHRYEFIETTIKAMTDKRQAAVHLAMDWCPMVMRCMCGP